MQIELNCTCCHCRYAPGPGSGAGEVLERMTEEGPWHILGDGETFEDTLFAALNGSEKFPCPDCGEPLCVSQESLGRLAMEMLTCW